MDGKPLWFKEAVLCPTPRFKDLFWEHVCCNVLWNASVHGEGDGLIKYACLCRWWGLEYKVKPQVLHGKGRNSKKMHIHATLTLTLCPRKLQAKYTSKPDFILSEIGSQDKMWKMKRMCFYFKFPNFTWLSITSTWGFEGASDQEYWGTFKVCKLKLWKSILKWGVGARLFCTQQLSWGY